VRWCDIRLSRNPALAGLKHLNRLEEVLAQIEFSATDCDEGLLMDTEGELVSATAGNVFIVRNLTLATPDLRYCGVRGVMRSQVLRVAVEQGIAVSEEPLWPQDLQEATEVFITNAVRGIRPVATLDSQHWSSGPMVRRLTTALGI
jgi:4-amino-4-deoxychorismate lyase